jgi:hypothetical protein
LGIKARFASSRVFFVNFLSYWYYQIIIEWTWSPEKQQVSEAIIITSEKVIGFMKVKIIDHHDLSLAERQINEFLKKEEVKEIVDIKFGTRIINNGEEHTFVIIYEENMKAGVEDPQIYE